MNQQETKIDANKVIDYLAQENAVKSKEIAILQATIDELKDVNGKQQDVIKAYEDKDALSSTPEV